MTVTMYGIKNCDTVKKARDWLAAKGIDYAFHDYKTAGLNRATLEKWIKQVSWETLLNRAGTTFRKLPDAAKQNIDMKKAVTLMLEHTSLVKRPVLEAEGALLVGFKPEVYAAQFGQAKSVPRKK